MSVSVKSKYSLEKNRSKCSGSVSAALEMPQNMRHSGVAVLEVLTGRVAHPIVAQAQVHIEGKIVPGRTKC
jgi:hypothetical protein